MKDHLEALTNIGILKELTDGVRSGKNQCTLYIKQVPESLSSESIEEFTSKYLNQLNISWSNYSASCRKMILSSESAVLGMEASNMLNTHSYDWFVLFIHQINFVSNLFFFFLKVLLNSVICQSYHQQILKNQRKIDRKYQRRIEK